jgi:hypothetical protein
LVRNPDLVQRVSAATLKENSALANNTLLAIWWILPLRRVVVLPVSCAQWMSRDTFLTLTILLQDRPYCLKQKSSGF